MKRITLLLPIFLPLVALMSLFKIFTPLVHAIEVSGPITSDTTWTVADSPYIVTDTLTIQAGVTLTIEAGVEVRSENEAIIVNEGHLEVAGNMSASTIITGFPEIYIGVNGSGNFNHALIYVHDTAPVRIGFMIDGNSDNAILLANTTIQNAVYPILTDGDSVHRLQMDNVTFSNNLKNRVYISVPFNHDNLSDQVTLTPQPGLEAYEIIGAPSYLNIPQGITLTLAAGTTLINTDSSETDPLYINVDGNLAMAGNMTTTAIISGFAGIQFGPTGSGSINHALILVNEIAWLRFGVGIYGNSDNFIFLNNTTIQNAVYPILTESDSVHRLQMDNVAFSNNVNNRVYISIHYPNENLSDHVTLTPQPGLEAYEITGEPFYLSIPLGITLTLEAGTTLLNGIASDPDGMSIIVQGHLAAAGNVTTSTTISGFNAIEFLTTGSGDINHGFIYANGSGPLRYGVGFQGSSDNLVMINNSIIQNALEPIVTEADSLHRLQMNNVTFLNNVSNRVSIYTGSPPFPERRSLSEDVTLTSQPGLEGYEAYPGFTIPENISLTLAAGTTFFGEDIQVNGRLAAEGTAVSPVTITSAADSSPGEWNGIIVDNGGEVVFDNAVLRYGSNNLSQIGPTSTVTLSHTQIISASLNGITVEAGNLNVSCSTLAGNGGNGLWLGNSGTPTVTVNQSSIQGNGAAGISNTNTVQVEAVNNWWGAADGPGGDGPGSGDAVFGNVLYTPWLSDAPTCPRSDFKLFLPVIFKP